VGNVFLVGGIVMMMSLGGGLGPRTAWTCVVAVFSLSIVSVVVPAVTHRPRVVIKPHGFTIYSVIGSESHQWEDIDGQFVVTKTLWSKTVVYRLTTAFNTRSVLGAFRSSPEELAALLNEHKQRSLTSAAKTEVAQDGSAQRFEFLEKEKIEKPLNEERRVIDNSQSSAEVRRTITLSKEWSQTITIDNATTTSVKAEASGKVWGIVDLKLEAERRIREKYSTSTETKQRVSDEVVITVPAKTKIEVVFAWKQVWQSGIIRAHAPDGSILELPYSFCLEPTFDQRQVESLR
jgi:hypothetical protein